MTGPIPITGPQTDRARIAPVPAWVVHEPYDAPPKPEEVFVTGGRATLLDDTQVDLSGSVRALHTRRAERVLTSAGAERVAQISIPFDPTCEILDIHYVRVIRDGVIIEHARPDAFEIMRRERSLERLVFDGHLTVHLIVPDVRPGDIVESACTVTGENPIHRGKHAGWVAFEWARASLETRHRILVPPHRHIRFRAVNGAPEPVISKSGESLDYRWRAVRRPSVEIEPMAPPWLPAHAGVQISEFASWAEIAALETPLYEHDAPLPEDLDSAVAEIAAAATSPKERAAEALRFVQSNIRYLALQIGDSGRLAPRPIEEIWKSRFGDCKDKARLFTVLARRLGLDACPALVNRFQGVALDEWLPTTAFDHVVVRMEIDGAAVWLDPTNRPQAGRFDNLVKPYFGWALPLRRGQAGLEQMSVEPVPVVEVEEKVALGPRPSSPAAYELRIVFQSWRADDLRERIANEGLSALGRGLLRQFQSMWPGIAAAEPMIAEDDAVSNRVSTTERYDLPIAWKRETDDRVSFTAHDFFIATDLPEVPPGPRRQDIFLGRPRTAKRRIEIDLPNDWTVEGWERGATAPGVAYRAQLTVLSRRKVLIEQRLEITECCVPASAADEYRNLVRVVRATSDFTVTSPTSGDHFPSRKIRLPPWRG